MTLVVNMLGGSGVGKSTAAAGLYSQMKMDGFNVELVREYVKNWAWDGKKVGEYDQVYIFGKQARSEYMLYGKVDYIITDSPIILSPIYEKYYNNNESMIEEAALKFLKKAKNNDVSHINLVLQRNKEFNPEGRYETAEQAKEVDIKVKEFIEENQLKYHTISCSDADRIKEMMEIIKNERKNKNGEH